MRKFILATVGLLCLLVSINICSQTINATLGGTVGDATGALIPGVTITATNTGTGIVNTLVTNESGAYNFASLQPGTYKVTAELPGFQTQSYTDVQLGGAQQVRLNFILQVGGVAQNVEVTIAADTLLATSSNSIGTILPEYKLRDLPAQSRNIFDLVRTTPGVQSSNNTIGIMAGGRLGDVNATRDGVNVNDGRYENGAWSVIYSSPDSVEEVKIIVAPVDAETSRGSGQVSMVTRSGTNQFRGSVFWANHNSALDANSWFNNFNGVGKSYDNRNQYGARLGGPVIKNKTFFFALFEGQRDVKKSQAAGVTLTDYARQGIYRYFPGVDPANASSANPSVDRSGNPVSPAGATGPLSAIDLFGNCTFKGAPVPNCRSFRDPSGSRTAISTVPFMQEWFRRMPSPNEFTTNPVSPGSNTNQATDGLNLATIRFVRRQEGLDLTNGNGDEVDRDQYTARIDHNFNSRHKLSLIATKEKTWGTATQAGLRPWPDAYDGLALKRPYVYSIQLTSTLTNSLLNQFRLGKRASNNWQWGSADRGDAIGAEARKLHATANGIPYQITFTTPPGGGVGSGLQSFSNIGGFGRWREGINPLKSAADDLSWTVRKHAFKMGYEWRRNESNGFNDPNYTPSVTLGSPSGLAVNGIDGTAFPGMSSNAQAGARNLLYDLSGSVSSMNQAFGVVNSTDTKLVGTPIIRNNRHWNFQSEMSAYFKDDWKFRPSLTLNLGVHWEYYGQPYEHDGLAARVIGDESALRNVKCTSSPGTPGFTSTCTDLVQVQFVGKNSPHPEILTNLLGNDRNNFAPAVGFSWSLPWLGKDKTVVRAGYGINYEGALRNFITVDGVINTVPGINHISGGTGLPYTPSSYLSLTGVTLPIPFPTGTATSAPFLVQPTQRSLGLSTYSHVSPYTQNWNFEIQRELAKNTTFEIRYIGSKGTKRWEDIDLNAIDALGRSRALFDAFNTVRAGGESTLLNQMMLGGQFPGQAVINGTSQTAAMALRANPTTRAQIANGNVGGFLNSLNTNLAFSNATGTGNDRGTILRKNGFPDNYIVPSPQYSTVNVNGNNTNTKYHSMQLQVTRRLTAGFTNTTTWTWSKSMGPPANADFIDPNRRNAEKMLQSTDHMHQFTSNGTYELPFGTGHFMLGNAPGWVQQIVNKWQLGGIFNYNTGAPLTVTTGPAATTGIGTISNVRAKPNVAGQIPADIGTVTKASNGVFYFSGYTQITDPYVNNVSTLNGLRDGFTNKAIMAPNGQVILVNPQPGDLGTLGYTTLRGPREVRFDLNMVKRFRIHEAKEFEFRIDAINVLNTPNFSDPNMNMNGNGTFGQITGATGARIFVLNSRINF
ncbi:MAG TPA: TonB-dependent receptor [Terriglobia bacterium]|nr:TonB-dependent receptor [Terriglobia bacterium]